MMFLLIVIGACIFLIMKSAQHESDSSYFDEYTNVGSKPINIFEGKTERKSNGFGNRMVRFFCFWIACYLGSIILMAYAGYWPIFGWLSIKAILPSGGYFDWYAYLPLIITSLVGPFLFSSCNIKKNVFYERLAWWLFATGIVCWLLSRLGFGVHEANDGGMGDFAVLIGALPVFIFMFGLGVAFSEFLSWVFISLMSCKKSK